MRKVIFSLFLLLGLVFTLSNIRQVDAQSCTGTFTCKYCPGGQDPPGSGNCPFGWIYAQTTCFLGTGTDGCASNNNQCCGSCTQAGNNYEYSGGSCSYAPGGGSSPPPGGGAWCTSGHADCVGNDIGDPCGNGGTCQDNNSDHQCSCNEPPNPCAVPSLLVPSLSCNGDGTVSASFDWNDVSGATNYRFQMDDNSDFSSPLINNGSISSSSHTLTQGSNITRHARVRVETSNGSCTAPSAYSNVRTYTTPNCPVQNPPTCSLNPGGNNSYCIGDTINYTGTCNDGNGNLRLVELFYVNSTLANPATSDHIKFCSQIVSPVAGSGSCSSNNTWSAAGSYYVEVNGTDNTSGSNLACSSNPWCEWPPNNPPPTTLNCGAAGFTDCGANDLATVTVQNVGTPSISGAASCVGGTISTNTISWSSVTCGNSFEIYRCIGSSCTPTTPAYGTTSSTSFSDTAITPGTVYRYRIRAKSPVGNNFGPYSNIVTLTAQTCVPPVGQCSAPTLSVTKACNINNKADLTWSWSAISGAQSYWLQVDNNSNFSSPEVSTITAANQYTTINMNSAVSWYGRVRVQTSNAAQCTAPSDWSATVQTNDIPCCDAIMVPTGPLQMPVGEDQPFTVFVDNPDGGVANVNFRQTLNLPPVLSYDPSSVSRVPYSTTATAINGGTTNAYAQATTATDAIACTSNFVQVEAINPTCTIAVNPPGTPEPHPVELGENVPFTSIVTTVPEDTTVNQVVYTSNNQSIFCTSLGCNVSGSSTTSPYTVPFTPGPGAVPGNTATITAVATIGGGAATCEATSVVEIQDVDAWWQASGGDVITANLGSAELRSDVPSFLDDLIKFITDGTGGTPGIPAFGGNSSTVNSENVSSKDWIASGSGGGAGLSGLAGYGGDRYDSTFFTSLIPSGVQPFTTNNSMISGGTLRTAIINAQADENGYKWVYATNPGGLTVTSALNVLENKVIIFAQGAHITFNGNVSLEEANGGFLMVVSSGNINVGPLTTTMEGLYVADGTFDTCTIGPCTQQLNVRGSVVTWDAAPTLERDLSASNSNFDTPAEVFTFAPDLLMNYPSTLALPNIQWKEVAP